jgi:hypothetical protein
MRINVKSLKKLSQNGFVTVESSSYKRNKFFFFKIIHAEDSVTNIFRIIIISIIYIFDISYHILIRSKRKLKMSRNIFKFNKN